jgi:hypothetical protein
MLFHCPVLIRNALSLSLLRNSLAFVTLTFLIHKSHMEETSNLPSDH